MLDYLKRVLELTKPYRFRLVLGLLCGFLSGALSFTLPLSLTLAVDAVFPGEKASSTNTVPVLTANTALKASPGNPTSTNTNIETVAEGQAAHGGSQSFSNLGLASRLPAPLRNSLDSVGRWLHGSDHSSKGRLVLIISLIPIFMFLRTTLAYLNTYLLFWVGIRATNDLRVRLFQHLVNLPLGFFNRSSTGDLMARMEGIMAVNTTINGAFSVIIREPISIIVLVGLLVGMEPRLSLITLLVFPLCLIPVLVFGRKSRRSDLGGYAQAANLNKVMHESFTGMRVIKGYNLEPLVVTEFRRAADGARSFFMRSVRMGELPGPLIEFVGSIGVALVFAYFAFLSGRQAPAGNMFGFFFAVFNMYAPIKNLGRLNHQLAVARAAVEPAYQLLASQTTLPEPTRPKVLQARGAVIRFDNVGFSYGERNVLQSINLTIQPGQMVALVGRTGSGKTSIANLLLRFYDPVTGAISIGDIDIREVSSGDLRANMAVVTQETILFNDTIRHNIALGRPNATDAEIEAAAKHAYAHGFIMEKSQGYETLVGEKGVNLSGGQRQRIAIARAILRNAPVLILDEATNALDPESERIVQQALEALMEGRTTICIAHRLSTIQNADLIVVLDSGRIVETGTHAELMRTGGLYSKLHDLSSESAAGESPS